MMHRRRFRGMTAALLLATAAVAGVADAQMAGGAGMMGPGGMMGAAPDTAAPGVESPPPVDAGAARRLSGYIDHQQLACKQCHALDTGGVAPSFAEIASYYARHPRQQHAMRRSIVDGIGRMPGGLASPDQAAELERLIVDLAR